MDIPRRDLELALDPMTVPRDWCHADAYHTTFMNALSLLFPEGEKFFVDAVKQQKSKITDPALLKQVAGFIGQEAMHGKEHRAFNELLVAHGFTSAPGVDRRLRGFLKLVRRTLSPMSQLAATCALEHFTAMLAEQLLSDERVREELHVSVRPLWLWHALEESEHKAVAFDVYRAAGGGYARRVAIMLLTTVVFFAAQALAHGRMMSDRKIVWKPWTWLRGMRRMWIWPGYFIRLLPAYLSYFRPGFHPDDRDTRTLLATWREVLFGEQGALRDRVRLIAS
ncbi:MAG: metal-dependent hydrolase [Myxococcota bacterium]|nr:metal-dependent hydrolase [Deltaproteobacteria bacterium]MDQ3335255.1 metal-dependent hydrolase [Myxococcota bacterium]